MAYVLFIVNTKGQGQSLPCMISTQDNSKGLSMENQNDSNMVNYACIGQRIRRQRKAKGLSQEQLAEQIGVSLSFLGHIERGTRVASVETLARLCKALELDMHYVVFGYSSGYSPCCDEARLLHDLKELINKY